MTDFLTTPIQASNAFQQVEEIRKESRAMFDSFAVQTQKTYDKIWNNLDPTCTPDKMWEAIGTAGVSALKTHIAACTFIETVCPGTLSPRFLSAQQPITINEDGSIKITGQ